MSDYQTCTCIARDHDHAAGACSEPPVIRGGICRSCHAWYSRPKEGTS